MKDPTLIHRMYNGLDERTGFQIVKPIGPLGDAPIATDRAQLITYPMPHKVAKIPWWRRLIKEMLGV